VKLKAACEPNEWAWVAACVATSGRLSEVNRLRVEDYDPVDKVLHVRGTKTEGADRKIPILPEFEPLWAEALPHLPVSWPNVSKRLPERCRRAKIAPATPNDLRRTHATWLVRDGVSFDLVAKMLGHKSTAMVYRTYGRLEGKALGAAIFNVPKTSKTELDEGAQGSENEQENPTKAPWRNGRRGGFKSQSVASVSGALAKDTASCDSAATAGDRDGVPKTSKSPGAWLLGYVAYNLRALPGQEAA
jgi:hypothetical protein